MSIHHRIAILAIVLAAVLGTAEAASSAPTCEEDQKCWTWSTMGNEKRGVILRSHIYAGGVFRVVGPCTFRKLELSGRIDWTRTDRLRGDHLARRYGCNVNYPA